MKCEPTLRHPSNETSSILQDGDGALCNIIININYDEGNRKFVHSGQSDSAKVELISANVLDRLSLVD